MGFWGKLGNIAKGVGMGVAGAATGGILPAIIGGAGAALGSASQASASNRGTQMEASLAQEQVNQQRQRELFDQLMAREQAQQAGMKSSLRDAQHADYIINTHPGDYKPATLQTSQGARTLSSFGFGPKAPGPGEQEAAYAVADQARQRLLNGGTLTQAPVDRGEFQFDPKLLKAGGWEKLMGILGPGMQAYGTLAGRQNTEK